MNRLAPFLLIAFLLGGWEIACRVMQVPVYFLPPPSAVGAALLEHWPALPLLGATIPHMVLPLSLFMFV